MTTHPTDLDRVLRTLDPAAAHPSDDDRAARDLALILASDPAEPAAVAPFSARRRRTTRLALAGAAVAVVTVGVVALPGLGGGDKAFASWQATPSGLGADQRAEAAESCRKQYGDMPVDDLSESLASARVAVAERRGVWTTVVLAGDDGFSALCISDSSSGWFSQSMIGSIGTPSDHTAPAAREVRATDLGVGSMEAGEISMAAGMVGEEVTGVAYESAAEGRVEATVAEGRFALWMPGDELERAQGVPVRVEVTYADGTTGTADLSLE